MGDSAIVACPARPSDLPGSWPVYSGKPPDSQNNHGQHILLHPHRPRWGVLNDTGLRIARSLGAGASIVETAADLVAAYGITAAAARIDTAYVFNFLSKEGFLGNGASGPSQRTPELKTAFLHITSRCNLSCPHCYVLSDGVKHSGPQDLSTEIVVKLIDELAGLGGRAVTLSGGEALLHPGVRRMLKRAADRSLEIRLLTNGTLLDREWAAFLADLPIHVQVSLDGSRPEIHDAVRGKGNFLRALQAVERLQQAGLGEKINLCATVMRSNVEDLAEIILLAEKLGVPLVRFLPLRRKGMAEAAWTAIGTGFGVCEQERFYRMVADRQVKDKPALAVSCGLSGFLLKLPPETPEDEIWCPIGRQIDIGFDGEAYPCVLMMEERFRVGNIHRESLESMTRSDAMRQTCRALAERRSDIVGCARCLWRNLCQAGCMGQALDNTGTIQDVDDFCGYRKKAYEEAFDRILAQ